jgi:uncharacterized protein
MVQLIMTGFFMRTWFFMLLLLAHFDLARALPARPASGLLDETLSLSDNDRVALEKLLVDIRSRGEALDVAIVQRSEGPPREYATGIFNHWGIGDSERNRGVLIFVAIADRKAEIVLGDGINSAEVRFLTDQIMQDDMVPEFKRGNYAMGAFRGATAVSQKLFGFSRVPLESESAGDPQSEVEALQEARSGQNTERVAKAKELPSYYAVAGFAMLAAPFALLAWMFKVIFGRGKSRRCRQCRTQMALLDEHKDDDYLNHAERIEERLDSVRYDVWLCLECNHVDKLSKEPWFKAHNRCPQCQAKTFQSQKHEIQAAGFHTDGRGEIRSECLACGYKQTNAYTIHATGSRSTGNAIGSYSSSSSYRSSSSSSSSRSRGSSSGGGSSGSW